MTLTILIAWLTLGRPFTLFPIAWADGVLDAKRIIDELIGGDNDK